MPLEAADNSFREAKGGLIASHFFAALRVETSFVINQRTPRIVAEFKACEGVTVILGNLGAPYSDAAFGGIVAAMHLNRAVQGMSKASIKDSKLMTTKSCGW